MHFVQVKDRKFELYISGDQLHETISRLARSISQDFRDKDPLFLVVLNGAFMFAGDLFKKLDFPCRVSFVKLASYAGTQTTAQITQLIGLNEGIENEHVIVLEDIIDTGHTMAFLLEALKEKSPASVKLATLLYKPEAFIYDYPVDYVGLKIPTDFIVGYGLDYDGYGRNLSDIYRIVNP